MTREEAISWLKKINVKYIRGGDEDFDEKRREAIGMAIAALREQPQWISVEERLPEKGVFVLFHYAKNGNPTSFAKNTMAVGRYEYGMFLVEGCSVCITHWMPLPEQPKEEV